MGTILSFFRASSDTGVQSVDISGFSAYHYPPKSGNYFANYFIMGGDRFDSQQPECYLFGDNEDLNYLGSKPVPFPYSIPTANEPCRALKSVVNIRRDSLHLVRVEKSSSTTQVFQPAYNIEFTLDTTVRVAVSIYYFATEDGHSYRPRDPRMNSETFWFKPGLNQTFTQASHVIRPDQFVSERWQFSASNKVFPIVIQCVEDDEPPVAYPQSHVTLATIDRLSDGSHSLKAIKQKHTIDGVTYLLQEIYGVEQKLPDTAAAADDAEGDVGAECIICMYELRDTIILPCRHLCLCHQCAESLRYQANNCPICRVPFRALLQIRALRRKGTAVRSGASAGDTVRANSSDWGSIEDIQEEPVNVPAGFELVPLIEALTGRPAPRSPGGSIRRRRSAAPSGGAAARRRRPVTAAGSLDRATGGSGGDDAGERRGAATGRAVGRHPSAPVTSPRAAAAVRQTGSIPRSVHAAAAPDTTIVSVERDVAVHDLDTPDVANASVHRMDSGLELAVAQSVTDESTEASSGPVEHSADRPVLSGAFGAEAGYIPLGVEESSSDSSLFKCQ